MPLAGFQPTIPVFKRAKTFHALDRAATLTGEKYKLDGIISMFLLCVRTIFDVPDLNGSLVTLITPQLNVNFAWRLCFRRSIARETFRIVLYMMLSFSRHKYARPKCVGITMIGKGT
jgi:hypothetical protein